LDIERAALARRDQEHERGGITAKGKLTSLVTARMDNWAWFGRVAFATPIKISDGTLKQAALYGAAIWITT
jgi:hypothetical protein